MTPKRTVLGRKHVVWAIQHKNRSNGLAWVLWPGCVMMKKIQDNKKSQKCYISPISGEAPTGLIRPKSCMVGDHDNHVSQVSIWNFHGLRFYRGPNFRFSSWFLHGPYNSAALMRCLWLYTGFSFALISLTLNDQNAPHHFTIYRFLL